MTKVGETISAEQFNKMYPVGTTLSADQFNQKYGAQRITQEQPKSSAMFPVTGKEGAFGASIKALANIPKSAWDFGRGLLNMLNPFEIASTVGDISSTIKEESKKTGESPAMIFLKSFKETPSSAYEVLTPQFIKTAVSETQKQGIAVGLQKSMQTIVEDPVGQTLPLLLIARGAAGKMGKGAEFDAMVKKVTRPILKPKPLTKITRKISETIKGKTEEQIINTPADKVWKLNPKNRQIWFEQRKNLISEEALSQKSKVDIQAEIDRANIETQRGITAQQLETDFKNRIDTTTKNIESLQKEIKQTATNKVLELRPKLAKAMGEQSEIYRSILQEELLGKENLKVDAKSLNDYIDVLYSEEPNIANVIKQKFNIAGNNKVVLLGDIVEFVQELKQDFALSSKRGTRVFTPDEMITDKALHTLTDFLRTRGVDFSKSNEFWAKYAPIRDQWVSDFKPFNRAETKTSIGVNTLITEAKGLDPKNTKFIQATENLLGEKIIPEIKFIIEKLDSAKKTKLALELEKALKLEESKILTEQEAELLKTRSQIAKKTFEENQRLSNKELERQMFDVNRQARVRDLTKSIIKKFIIGLGIYSASSIIWNRFMQTTQ